MLLSFAQVACVDGGADDAGSPAADGGGEPEDGGTISDGGTLDGGDVEPDPCANVDTLADLGSLSLNTGWNVIDSAPFGSGLTYASATWVMREDGNPVLWRLNDVGDILSANWFPLFPSIPESFGNIFTGSGDDAAANFVSTQVAVSGNFAMMGYTSFDADTGTFPGKIVIIDMSDFSIRRVNAPGNFSYVATADTLFINGLGAGDLEGAGVYAVDLATLDVTHVGSFPGADFGGSGYSFLTAEDVVGSGYFDTNFTNKIFVTSSTDLIAAAVPVDFSTLPEALTESTLGIYSHANGYLNLRGSYDANFTAVYDSLDFVAVSDTLTVAASTPVLTFVDSCTSVLKVEGLPDGSLLVGLLVGDNAGRLVHLERE